MCVCVRVTVWEPKIGPIRMVDPTHFRDNHRRRRRRVGNRNQLMTIQTVFHDDAIYVRGVSCSVFLGSVHYICGKRFTRSAVTLLRNTARTRNIWHGRFGIRCHRVQRFSPGVIQYNILYVSVACIKHWSTQLSPLCAIQTIDVQRTLQIIGTRN